MFREKMKLFTTVVFVLSLLVGELAFSIPNVAFASSRSSKPVASAPAKNAAWVRCNVDGDNDADDWCWVNNARYFGFNGSYYIFRNGRWVLRNRYLLPKNLVFRNGYIMRNGRIIGYMNNLGNPIYYYMP